MKRVLVVVPLVVVAVAAAVLATRARQPAAPEEELRFPEVVDAILLRVDENDDGIVSSDEYAKSALPDEPIDRYDSNRDGRISRLELERSFLRTSPTAVVRGRLTRTRSDATPLSR
jgi:hypothetical protein